MDQIVSGILSLFFSGGPNAIPALFALVIVMLWWDRRNLLNTYRIKDEKIDKILDEYYKGNMTLAEAINSLRIVLIEIKNKI